MSIESFFLFEEKKPSSSESVIEKEKSSNLLLIGLGRIVGAENSLFSNLDAFLKRDILWNAKKCINYGLVHSIW